MDRHESNTPAGVPARPSADERIDRIERFLDYRAFWGFGSTAKVVMGMVLGAGLLCLGMRMAPRPIADADRDGDWHSVLAGGDCDDMDPTVHPLAIDFCDGLDNDCDGAVDEGRFPLAFHAFGRVHHGMAECPGALVLRAAASGQVSLTRALRGYALVSLEGDIDGDGFTVLDGDCDDFDSWIRPEDCRARLPSFR